MALLRTLATESRLLESLVESGVVDPPIGTRTSRRHEL